MIQRKKTHFDLCWTESKIRDHNQIKQNRQTNKCIEIRQAINDNLYEGPCPKISTNTACMAVEGDNKLEVKMTMKYGKEIHLLINEKFILKF